MRQSPHLLSFPPRDHPLMALYLLFYIKCFIVLHPLQILPQLRPWKKAPRGCA